MMYPNEQRSYAKKRDKKKKNAWERKEREKGFNPQKPTFCFILGDRGKAILGGVLDRERGNKRVQQNNGNTMVSLRKNEWIKMPTVGSIQKKGGIGHIRRGGGKKLFVFFDPSRGGPYGKGAEGGEGAPPRKVFQVGKSLQILSL